MTDDKICPHCGKGKSPKYPMCKACSDAGVTNASSAGKTTAEPKPAEIKKEEKPKEPERLAIEKRLNGRDGLYDLDIQIVVVNGPQRVVDVKVLEVLKQEWDTILVKGRTYFDKTDANGFLSIPLNPDGFEEERRKIVVQVIGTALDYPVYLDGPKREWEPMPGVGFLANLLSLDESKRRYSR